MKNFGLKERFHIVHETFSMLERYFAHWNYVPKLSVATLRNKYIEQLLDTEDRNKFGLLMCRMLAELKNGHTFYYDEFLYKQNGRNMGFYAFYHGKERKWVVSSSSTRKINVGDVLLNINNQTTESFFAGVSKYISGSSELEIRNRLFRRPFLFPMRFRLKTDRGTVVVNRGIMKSAKSPKIEPVFRIIDKEICYMKIPSFAKNSYAESAIRFFKKHSDCKSVIIDIRDNVGGNTPIGLLRTLMNKKYRRFEYREIKQEQLSYILDIIYTKHSKVKTRYKIIKSKKIKPNKSAYSGSVFILVNYNTVSAGEDFAYPFKDNRRAKLIGTKTCGSNGSTFMHDFGKEITVGIGAVRVLFPNGSRFEGTGIKPDIVVYPTLENIKTGEDRILKRAIALSKHG